MLGAGERAVYGSEVPGWPDGSTVGGSGDVATAFADIPGNYSVIFTAKTDRECQPDDWQVGPATATASPVGACCFFDTGACAVTCMESCNAQNGIYAGHGSMCIPGDFCMPKCDDCHPIVQTVAECYHFAGSGDGVPCGESSCIENVIDTASCTYYPDRVGPFDCDTRTIPGEAAIIQNVHTMTCPPMTIHWEELYTEYFGCGDSCTEVDPPTKVTCVVPACTGEFAEQREKGDKRACGCP